MSRKNRASSGFGLSFMDVICCGFGAIILLLLITKTKTLDTVERQQIGTQTDQEFATFLAEKSKLNQSLEISHELAKQLQRQRKRLAEEVTKLKAELAQVQAELAQVQTEEEKQRQLSGISEAQISRTPIDPVNVVAGVPLDASYIIFVIDTSGSMKSAAWGAMLSVMRQILDVYPQVQGIQVMSDMGAYLYPSHKKRWLQDTPGIRQEIFRQVRGWNEFSNSSPVEGIREAILDYRQTQSNIAIYIMGDDFQGSSIEDTLNEIDRLNQEAGSESQKIRIHAIGFPVYSESYQIQPKFAALMRELAFRNEGAFLGINSLRP